jgi:hypothetical protein
MLKENMGKDKKDPVCARVLCAKKRVELLFLCSAYYRLSSNHPPSSFFTNNCVQTMECGRTVLPLGSETFIIIFDLSNFGLDNMDWRFVRLFVQCFENYYPESLAVCVVHRAPFVFWGLWKLIQPLLDSSVASKFVFTRSNTDLHKVIPREVLPMNPYGGLDDWKYEYTPMEKGENDRMLDVEKKEDLLMERESLEIKFDIVTRSWIKNARQVGQTSVDRDVVAMELREQYFRLCPYIRAKNMYQRQGVANDGQVTWSYNIKSKRPPWLQQQH